MLRDPPGDLRKTTRARHQRERTREEVAQRVGQHEHSGDAGDGELQSQIVRRRGVEQGARRRGGEERCEPVRAAAAQVRGQRQPRADACPHRGPRGAQEQHLRRDRRRRAERCEGRGSRPASPGSAEPEALRRPADEQGDHGEVQPGAGQQVHQTAGGEILLDLGRNQRPVSRAEGGDQPGARGRGADLRAAPREPGAQLGNQLPGGRRRGEDLGGVGRPLVGDPSQGKVAPAVALARIQGPRRLVEPGEEADTSAATDDRRALDEDECERSIRGVVQWVAGAGLQPLDAEHDGEPARARLGLEHGAFESHGLAPAPIQRRIEERGVEGSVSRGLPCGAAAEEPQRRAKREGGRGSPAHRRQAARHRGGASQRDRQPGIPTQSEIRGRGEHRACRQKRPPHRPSPRPKPTCRTMPTCRPPVGNPTPRSDEESSQELDAKGKTVI